MTDERKPTPEDASPLGETERLVGAAQLARDVYKHVYGQVTSFEFDFVGEDLAYLLGALLDNDFVEFADDRPILGILRPQFPPDSALWDYIDIVEDDDDEEEGESL